MPDSIPEIIVVIEGGAVQDVIFPLGVPAVRVVFRDFDTDGVDADALTTDEFGTYCRIEFAPESVDMGKVIADLPAEEFDGLS